MRICSFDLKSGRARARGQKFRRHEEGARIRGGEFYCIFVACVRSPLFKCFVCPVTSSVLPFQVFVKIFEFFELFLRLFFLFIQVCIAGTIFACCRAPCTATLRPSAGKIAMASFCFFFFVFLFLFFCTTLSLGRG